MDNFKYAPGQPGYGTTGIDGSSGLAGLAVYFTAYDGGGTDTTTIKNKIDNNLILSPVVHQIPGYPTRKYQNGDIFIDINGKAYEIDLANPNRFAYAGYNLSGTSLFIPSGIPGASPERYSNTYPSKIIDTVNSAVEILDYTASPAIIYGISSKKFARIEYSNTDPDGMNRNPFTLFIGADSTPGAEKAIALVRDIINNTFRLGNLDDSDALRPTNLIFDVKSLTQNKTNNEFTRAEADGTIITNHEINTNNLMTPVFKKDPTSFISASNTATKVTVSWNKSDFFPNGTQGLLSDIKANLHFSTKQPSYNGFDFPFTPDPFLKFRPMVFADLGTSGSVEISGLSNGVPYEAYISFFDNGWVRNSKILNVATGIDLVITNPPAVCTPGTVNIASPAVTAGSTPGLTLTYWTNAGATNSLSNPSSVGAGTYYIKAVGSIGGESIQPVTATVLPLPTPGLTSDRQPSNAFCAGTVAHFTASGGANYNFRVNGTSQQNSTSNLYNRAVQNGETIDVIVSSAQGCVAATIPAIGPHTVYANPTASLSGLNSVAVGSGGHVYTTQGGNGNYLWTISGGTITAGGSTSDNTATVTWTSAGSKWIAVGYTNSNGCVAPSVQYPVTVISTPVPTVSGPAAPCINVGGQVYSTGSFATYTWTVSAGGTIDSGQGTGSISVTWTTTGAKTVQVAVTDSYGGSATSAAYSLDVKARPVPGLSGTASVCQGSAGNVYTTESGMSNYVWNISGGTITAGGGAGNNTATVTWNTVGAQSISVNYTNTNGCVGTSATSLGVTVNAYPSPTVSGPINSIVHNSATYTTQGGNSDYAWVITGGTITSGGTTSSIDVTWNTAGSQSITVSYTNASGCRATSPALGVYVDYVTSSYSYSETQISYSDNPGYQNLQSEFAITFTNVPATTRFRLAWTRVSQFSSYEDTYTIYVNAQADFYKNNSLYASDASPTQNLNPHQGAYNYTDPPIVITNFDPATQTTKVKLSCTGNNSAGSTNGWYISNMGSLNVTYESGEYVNINNSTQNMSIHLPCPTC